MINTKHINNSFTLPIGLEIKGIRWLDDDIVYGANHANINTADQAERRRDEINKQENSPAELQKARARWKRDVKIIQDIVSLEKELGRNPNLLDLLCKFSRFEITAVSDLLPILGVSS